MLVRSRTESETSRSTLDGSSAFDCGIGSKGAFTKSSNCSRNLKGSSVSFQLPNGRDRVHPPALGAVVLLPIQLKHFLRNLHRAQGEKSGQATSSICGKLMERSFTSADRLRNYSHDAHRESQSAIRFCRYPASLWRWHGIWHGMRRHGIWLLGGDFIFLSNLVGLSYVQE